jgi:hypothetical protein
MDESTRQLLKETVFFEEEKRRYCRDGIRIAIMQIYDQEKRRKFRIESELGKGQK